MEWSFKYYSWIAALTREPHFMVMFAAFGVPLLMLAIVIPLYILRKLGFPKAAERMGGLIYPPIVITWILGFVVMIIFSFTGVDAIRMFLCWCVLLLCSFMFTLVNRKAISQWMKETGKKKPF